jgi:hypothetical protein
VFVVLTLKAHTTTKGVDGVPIADVESKRKEGVGKIGCLVRIGNHDEASGNMNDGGASSKDRDCCSVGTIDQRIHRIEGSEVLLSLEVVPRSSAVEDNSVENPRVDTEEGFLGGNSVEFVNFALVIGNTTLWVELVTLGGRVDGAFWIVSTVGAEGTVLFIARWQDLRGALRSGSDGGYPLYC